MTEVLTLAGGLALFLYGMRLSADFLQKIAGRHMRKIVGRLTGNRFAAAGVGAAVTVATNSSSATGVILVTLTNAEIIASRQALAVLLGAAVGTTVTIQIIAFKLTTWSLALVVAGFALSLFRRFNIRNAGGIILAFGFIFFGMHLMSEAMQPLRQDPALREWIASFGQNRLLMLASGLLLTALIQSSSASIGILVAIVMSGGTALEPSGCFAFVLGANVGTCVTALIASIGTSVGARRVAVGFLIAKTAAVAAFIPLIGPFSRMVEGAAGWLSIGAGLPRLIGHSHLAFNVALAAVFLSALPLLEKVLERLVREREDAGAPKVKYLSRRVLANPAVALTMVRRELLHMLETALAMVDVALDAFKKPDAGALIRDFENTLDALTSEVIRYLAKLSQADLDDATSDEIILCFNIADDTEALGDVVHNALLPRALKIREKGFDFSPEGWRDITDLHALVTASIRELGVALRMENAELAARAAARKKELEDMEREMRLRHLERLARGKPESVETSSAHLDVLVDLRSLSGYAAAIAGNLEKLLA